MSKQKELIPLIIIAPLLLNSEEPGRNVKVILFWIIALIEE